MVSIALLPVIEPKSGCKLASIGFNASVFKLGVLPEVKLWIKLLTCGSEELRVLKSTVFTLGVTKFVIELIIFDGDRTELTLVVIAEMIDLIAIIFYSLFFDYFA